MILNPALSVKTERFSVVEGKTPEVTVDQARLLIASIPQDTPLGIRDRAIVGTLIYTAARVGAIAKLKIGDLVDEGTQLAIRFQEKGGKQRSIPVRHDLQQFLQAYLQVAVPAGSPKEAPLFRSAAGRTGRLTDQKMSAIDRNPTQAARRALVKAAAGCGP